MVRRSIWRLFGWLVLPVILGGCASVVPTLEEQDDSPLLPQPRLPDDVVVLEVTFVDVPRDADWKDEVWSEFDEQHLAPQFRHAMQTNGFRCGVVGVQLPPQIREQLDKRANRGIRGVLTDLSAGPTATDRSRRIHSTAGKRSEIVTSGQRDSLVVLVDDGEDVMGQTFRQAQTVFLMRAFPLPDGRARVELTPEIHFGPTKQRWTSGEGVFRMEAGQDRRTFNDLKIEATLSAGQTMAVATLGSSRSLGGNFFLSGQSDEKMLLIRLAQAQQDDLFEMVEEPVAPKTPARLENDNPPLRLTTQLD